jgi:hypothetical protein
MGLEGSYLLGLDPSKIPPWGVARSVAAAEADEDTTVMVFVTTEAAIEEVIVLAVSRVVGHGGYRAGPYQRECSVAVNHLGEIGAFLAPMWRDCGGERGAFDWRRSGGGHITC